MEVGWELGKREWWHNSKYTGSTKQKGKETEREIQLEINHNLFKIPHAEGIS